MAGRAQTSNPVRKITHLASRQAVLDLRGASGGGRAAFAPSGFAASAPASANGVDGDGNETWTALTELDTTDDIHALTAV
jgi:hypothetical protein